MKANHVNTGVKRTSEVSQDGPLTTILNTHDDLAAYYDIAMHRFVDNFAIQVVERHLLGPNCSLRVFSSDYVMSRLLGDKHAAKLNELAGEGPNITQKRSELCNEREILEESLDRVQSFGVC